MKMSGLPEWMHWMGWMLNSLTILLFTVTLTTICLFVSFSSNGAVYEFADFSLFWIILVIYVIWATSYCFTISAFFERRKKNYLLSPLKEIIANKNTVKLKNPIKKYNSYPRDNRRCGHLDRELFWTWFGNGRVVRKRLQLRSKATVLYLPKCWNL